MMKTLADFYPTLSNRAITCQGCGHITDVSPRYLTRYPSMNVLICDVDSGGCGAEIVVRIEVELQVKTTYYNVDPQGETHGNSHPTA